MSKMRQALTGLIVITVMIALSSAEWLAELFF